MISDKSIWKEETDEQKINKIIAHLFSYLNDKGLVHEFESNILRSELNLSIKPELRSYGTILRTLKKLKESNDATAERFGELYYGFFKVVKKKNVRHIDFILPLNIEIDCDKKFHFDFLGESISISQVGYDLDLIKLDDLSKFRNEYHTFSNYYQNAKNYIIKFCIELLPLQSISKEFESIYYVLKGLMEFTYGYFDARIFSSYESPRARIPFPNWVLKQENGKFELLDIQTDHAKDTKILKVDINKFNMFLKNCEVFKELPEIDSINELLTVCLRMYATAREAKYSEWAFLGYWQIAETITLVSMFGGKTEKVVNRLKIFSKLLNKNNIEISETLKEIGKKRNDFVHKGLSNIDEEMITYLKYHCDVGMMWLFNNRSKICTIFHLEKFYSLATGNEKELDRTLEVIEFIRKSK